MVACVANRVDDVACKNSGRADSKKCLIVGTDVREVRKHFRADKTNIGIAFRISNEHRVALAEVVIASDVVAVGVRRLSKLTLEQGLLSGGIINRWQRNNR